MVRGSNKEGVAPCHHLKLIRRSQLRCPTSGVICGWAALSTTTKTCTSLYASFHPIGPNPGPSSWRSKETTATRSLSHTATSRSWYSGLPPAERDMTDNLRESLRAVRPHKTTALHLNMRTTKNTKLRNKIPLWCEGYFYLCISISYFRIFRSSYVHYLLNFAEYKSTDRRTAA